MNKIILIGRLTKDPELRYTTNNVAVANFSLAVTRDFKNQEGDYDADFINCVAYKKLAETITEYTRKGDKFGLDGRLQTRTYENSEGKKVFVSEVVVNGIEFLEAKKEKSASKEEVSRTDATEEFENDPFSDFGESITIDENDLPF
jgi:single-strand DNA-binding protein